MFAKFFQQNTDSRLTALRNWNWNMMTAKYPIITDNYKKYPTITTKTHNDDCKIPITTNTKYQSTKCNSWFAALRNWNQNMATAKISKIPLFSKSAFYVCPKLRWSQFYGHEFQSDAKCPLGFASVLRLTVNILQLWIFWVLHLCSDFKLWIFYNININ